MNPSTKEAYRNKTRADSLKDSGCRIGSARQLKVTVRRADDRAQLVDGARSGAAQTGHHEQGDARKVDALQRSGSHLMER